MICLGCKHSYIDVYGVECDKGCTPFWDEHEEREDCDSYQIKRPPEEEGNDVFHNSDPSV